MEAVGADELVGGFAGEGLDFSEQGGAGHVEGGGELFEAEIWV